MIERLQLATSPVTLAYRVAITVLSALTLYVGVQTLDLAFAIQADGQRTNQTIVELRFSLVEVRTENKLLYEELVRVGNEKRAVEAEVNRLQLEAAEERRRQSRESLVFIR